MESDAISRWTVSELSSIVGHPAGVRELLGVEEPKHQNWCQNHGEDVPPTPWTYRNGREQSLLLTAR